MKVYFGSAAKGISDILPVEEKDFQRSTLSNREKSGTGMCIGKIPKASSERRKVRSMVGGTSLALAIRSSKSPEKGMLTRHAIRVSIP